MSRRHKIGSAAVVVGLLLALGWGAFALGKSLPPAPITTDDLVGVWSAKVSVVEYDLMSGSQSKFNGAGTFTFTKIDDTTLHIEYTGDGGNFGNEAIFIDDTLLIGAGDDDVLASAATAVYATVKGQPGKLSAKGQFLDYDTGDNYLDSGTVTLKQAPR